MSSPPDLVADTTVALVALLPEDFDAAHKVLATVVAYHFKVLERVGAPATEIRARFLSLVSQAAECFDEVAARQTSVVATAPTPVEPADPIPEGWSIKPGKDGHQLLHWPTGLYVNIVLAEVVAVEPAWADGPDELDALCAALCWLRTTLGRAGVPEAREVLRRAAEAQS